MLLKTELELGRQEPERRRIRQCGNGFGLTHKKYSTQNVFVWHQRQREISSGLF